MYNNRIISLSIDHMNSFMELFSALNITACVLILWGRWQSCRLFPMTHQENWGNRWRRTYSEYRELITVRRYCVFTCDKAKIFIVLFFIFCLYISAEIPVISASLYKLILLIHTYQQQLYIGPFSPKSAIPLFLFHPFMLCNRNIHILLHYVSFFLVSIVW